MVVILQKALMSLINSGDLANGHSSPENPFQKMIMSAWWAHGVPRPEAVTNSALWHRNGTQPAVQAAIRHPRQHEFTAKNVGQLLDA